MSECVHPFQDRKTAILKYEPVELNGLVYYPIKVADYGKWQAVKPVLCLRQGTLPAVYACMTYLQCVWALQIDEQERGAVQNRTWDLLAGLLFLSLRLSDNDKIQPIGDTSDPRTITAIRIVQNGVDHDIAVHEFPVVRKLIAEQNGAELPDEADNPDLVEAAKDAANANDSNLNYDFADMLTSVSCAMHMRRKNLLDWTIREFDDVLRSIKRKYGFFLASIAESQGAKFTKGNPYPTWIFDRSKDEFAGLIPLDKLQSEHHANISIQDTAPKTTI